MRSCGPLPGSSRRAKDRARRSMAACRVQRDPAGARRRGADRSSDLAFPLLSPAMASVAIARLAIVLVTCERRGGSIDLQRFVRHLPRLQPTAIAKGDVIVIKRIKFVG